MITNKDIAVDESSYLISMAKLIGKPVVDIQGYLLDIGAGASFKLCRIVFADGTQLGVEGEHDFPYAVEGDKQPNFDEETLERLYEEDSDD